MTLCLKKNPSVFKENYFLRGVELLTNTRSTKYSEETQYVYVGTVFKEKSVHTYHSDLLLFVDSFVSRYFLFSVYTSLLFKENSERA